MREYEPVHWSNPDLVYVTRYEHVIQTLRNPKSSVQFMDYCERGASEYVKGIRELREKDPTIGSFTTMLRSDNPAHDRMKHLTIPHFSHQKINELAGHIETIVQKRINSLSNHSRVNIAQEMSRHIPVDTICHILGLPDEDKEMLTNWAHSLTLIVEPLQSSTDGIERVLEMLPDTIMYLVNRLEERRSNPRENDVVTDLVLGEVDGKPLPYEEIVSTVGLLFMAGIETTLFFMANALHTLTVNKKARREFIDITSQARSQGVAFYSDKKCMNAIDELLRYSGSVWITGRANLEDYVYEVDNGKVTVPKGSLITTVMASANRDPRIFKNPEEIDFARDNAHRQLTFSAGVHYCLGSHLARLESLILLDRFFTQFPEVELLEEPVWRTRLTFRGIEDLIVKLA
jgi:cytochrome P450 PksS